MKEQLTERLKDIIDELSNADLWDCGLASFYIERAIEQLKFALEEVESAT